jgi:hypothetical protein
LALCELAPSSTITMRSAGWDLVKKLGHARLVLRHQARGEAMDACRAAFLPPLVYKEDYTPTNRIMVKNHTLPISTLVL